MDDTANTAANAPMGDGIASPDGGNIEISSLLPNERAIDEASKVPVLDSDGKEHLFGKICRWPEEEGKTRRVMVVFIRHFFCGVRTRMATTRLHAPNNDY